MSISGAIASSSTGRTGGRGSIGGLPPPIRRHSHHKDPNEIQRGTESAKKKKSTEGSGAGATNGSGAGKSKSTCVLLVAVTLVTLHCIF